MEEIKENGEWKKMKVQDLNQPEIPETVAMKICNNLAISIETAAFLLNNEAVVST